MGQVFAYNHHDGFDDDFFLAGHELSDEERWCPVCEEYDTLITELHSYAQLIEIMESHSIIPGSGEYINLTEKYLQYAETVLSEEELLTYIRNITDLASDTENPPQSHMSAAEMIKYINRITGENRNMVCQGQCE